jgi:rhodanese-related sulfurtransferase
MAGMLTLAALAADPDRFHLIDVRDAEDYAAAHVAGAVHIPLAELTDRADLLNRLGHPDARWLEGGTNGWLAQNT